MKVQAGVLAHRARGNVLAGQKNTYYMIGIERNKDPTLSPKERNTSYFVILDDRKHGRGGKFPVFYDIDTGDYLEPPEGFLESDCQTLREWYSLNPKDDPTKDEVSVHKKPPFDALMPLSMENMENSDSEGYELTQDQIPEDDEDSELYSPSEDVGEEENENTGDSIGLEENTVEDVVGASTDEEGEWDDDPPF